MRGKAPSHTQDSVQLTVPDLDHCSGYAIIPTLVGASPRLVIPSHDMVSAG